MANGLRHGEGRRLLQLATYRLAQVGVERTPTQVYSIIVGRWPRFRVGKHGIPSESEVIELLAAIRDDSGAFEMLVALVEEEEKDRQRRRKPR